MRERMNEWMKSSDELIYLALWHLLSYNVLLNHFTWNKYADMQNCLLENLSLKEDLVPSHSLVILLYLGAGMHCDMEFGRRFSCNIGELWVLLAREVWVQSFYKVHGFYSWDLLLSKGFSPFLTQLKVAYLLCQRGWAGLLSKCRGGRSVIQCPWGTQMSG